MSLSSPCKYSFKDLVVASNTVKNTEVNKYLNYLYSLSQTEKNTEVKKLCNSAGWYFEDRLGDNDIIYTAFSPSLE